MNALAVALIGIVAPATPLLIATEGFIGGAAPVVASPPPPAPSPIPGGGGGGGGGSAGAWPPRIIHDPCKPDFWESVLPKFEWMTKYVYVWDKQTGQPKLVDHSVLLRLKKLVALSGSDNENEARAAADQVARLLREHDILDSIDECKIDNKTPKKIKEAIALLAMSTESSSTPPETEPKTESQTATTTSASTEATKTDPETEATKTTKTIWDKVFSLQAYPAVATETETEEYRPASTGWSLAIAGTAIVIVLIAAKD